MMTLLSKQYELWRILYETNAREKQKMHESDKKQIIVLTLYILKRKIYRFYKLKEIR